MVQRVTLTSVEWVRTIVGLFLVICSTPSVGRIEWPVLIHCTGKDLNRSHYSNWCLVPGIGVQTISSSMNFSPLWTSVRFTRSSHSSKSVLLVLSTVSSQVVYVPRNVCKRKLGVVSGDSTDFDNRDKVSTPWMSNRKCSSVPITW